MPPNFPNDKTLNLKSNPYIKYNNFLLGWSLLGLIILNTLIALIWSGNIPDLVAIPLFILCLPFMMPVCFITAPVIYLLISKQLDPHFDIKAQKRNLLIFSFFMIFFQFLVLVLVM